MIRVHGTPLKDKPWLIAKIDRADRADMWKFLHKGFFQNDTKKEKIIENMLRLWPKRYESRKAGIGQRGS